MLLLGFLVVGQFLVVVLLFGSVTGLLDVSNPAVCGRPVYLKDVGTA
jgi:hypothetical protein